MKAIKAKRILATVTAVFALVAALNTVAMANPVKNCTVLAETVSGRPGDLVTIGVEISDNPGFTNFGIALDYDTAQLQLVGLNLADAQGTAYLCGSIAAQNPSWKPAEDDNAKSNQAFDQSRTYPYVTCAAEQAVQSNGTLFSATFKVLDGATGTAAVTPIVSYIRNNSVNLPAFESVNATVQSGGVTIGSPITGIRLDHTELYLTVGASGVLTATLSPEGAVADVQWKSSANNVATVENGKVTAVAPGTADIMASAGGKIAQCTVTVVTQYDMNQDGKTDAADLKLAFELFNSGEALTGAQLAAVDADSNAEFDALDLMQMVAFINGQ